MQVCMPDWVWDSDSSRFSGRALLEAFGQVISCATVFFWGRM